MLGSRPGCERRRRAIRSGSSSFRRPCPRSSGRRSCRYPRSSLWAGSSGGSSSHASPACPRPPGSCSSPLHLKARASRRVLDAAGGAGFGLEDLDAAEREDLARIDAASQRIVFRHPLIRAAVVEVSTSRERRRAHRALAAVLLDQPERRARHLAEASVEPDEQVAALLEDAARSVLRRGDPGTAVTMLCRAADLSPTSTERSRRLAEAAFIGAEAMGEVASIAELLERGRQVSRTVSASLHYASAAALVMLGGDTPDRRGPSSARGRHRERRPSATTPRIRS